MSFDLPPARLETVLNFSNGRTSPERTDSGRIPVFGSNGVIGYSVQANSPPNTIIVGRVGSYCGSVHLSKEACWITDNAIRATAKEGNDPVFLFYLLKNLKLNTWRSGSGQPLLNQATLNAIEAPIPAPTQQRGISAFLDALDSRINLVHATNATLEAIAQDLFKSWFVDFEPVRAKMLGLAPEGMSAGVAAQFPGNVVVSVIGPIPEGWPVGRLEDLLVLQRGFDLPAYDRVPGEFPVIAASGASGTHMKAAVAGPGVVTGRSGVLGRVFLELGDYWPLNTTLWVKEFRRASPCYAYELLRLLDFKAHNAGSAVPTLNRNHVHGLPYVLPPRECVDAFEAIARPLHERRRANDRQADLLRDVRDTLLPRLISGQLRLQEAKDLVANV